MEPQYIFSLNDNLEQRKVAYPNRYRFTIGVDRAHSTYYSETAYARASEPKELYIVEDADHIDLYDRIDRIPFDKLESFFKDAC